MFYQKVGGNYDTLFLKTKAPSLSFIYQSLGCFHSLQPTTNAFEPPSIPALLPHGFVRWLTIQILLDPDEHSQYLQNAVEIWEVVNTDGCNFPKSIPRDAFPAEPDAEMVQWHEEVSRRLEYDYWKRNTPRPSPSFGTHYSYVSPDGPVPDDGYFPRARYRSPHVDPVPPHRRHRRRSSAEYPTISRKVQSAFFPYSERHRPGFASPRAPSPPPLSERPKSKAGKRFPFINPFRFGSDSDASSEDSRASPRDRSRKRYGRDQNLGVEASHARRHSHEAYFRKPRRDLSPDHQPSYREIPRHKRRHESDGRAYTKVHMDDPSRPASMRFHHVPVIDPVTSDIPVHPHPRYARGTGNYISIRDAEDRRRSSYSGSSGRSSGSGSERARPYHGTSHRSAKWANPVQNPARCVPVCVTEDVVYGPGPAMYER